MPEQPLYARVAELERQAAENPARYARRIRRWVILGIAAYIGLVLLALGLLALTVLAYSSGGRIHLAVPIAAGVALYGLLSALVARGDWDEGPVYPVSRADAPGLWQRLEDLRVRLGTPPVEIVEVDLNFNAHVGRKARFMLWGRGRTVLRLGLPLILLCDTDELASVLAHELGHHRAGHVGEKLRTMRTAFALYDVGMRFADGGGLAGLLIRPLARWYVPRLQLLVLPLEKEHEREADRAVVAAGLGDAGRRSMARMEALGKWYGTAFLAHRPRFASLRAGMERPLDPDSLAQALTAALKERPAPDDEHPAFSERLRLLGRAVDTGDREGIAALAREAATSDLPRAWDALFAPEFRARIEKAADEVFAQIAPEGPALPPTPLESARALAVSGDAAGARQAFWTIASSESAGPVDRIEAARALLRENPDSLEAHEAMRRLWDDPYVGLDALIDIARLSSEQYHAGHAGVMPQEIEEMGQRATATYETGRSFVAALHRDPSGIGPADLPIPPDVLRTLTEGLVHVTPARRAWIFWASHRSVPQNRFPLLVVDVGIELKSFKITMDDPKKMAEAIETNFPGPAGIPVLVGHSTKELTTIVGNRPPFWTRPAEGRPPAEPTGK